MKDNICFSTKITEQDLYKYNIHYAYTSSQGIFSIIIALLLIGAWCYGFSSLVIIYRILYPLIALLFLLYIPFSLKLKSRQQILQPVFTQPLQYELKDEGIVITSPTAETPAELPWNYVYKIVTWKSYLLIYSNRVNAYIIPKENIVDNYNEIIECIKEHVEDYKLSIK